MACTAPSTSIAHGMDPYEVACRKAVLKITADPRPARNMTISGLNAEISCAESRRRVRIAGPNCRCSIFGRLATLGSDLQCFINGNGRRPLVDKAIDRIRAVADDPNTFSNCHQFFAEECDGGPDTLKKTFDAAKLWKWPPQFPASGGAIANTPGENIAYMQYSYNKGVDWLAAALVHELLHNCGGGSEPQTPHRRADLARIYCMGPGKSEITLKAAIDLDKNLSMFFSYRRLIHEWAGGKLTLNIGSDINIFGLLRQADPVGREKFATELGSGTLGLRKRVNLWGAERYGGLLLTSDLGFGVDRFKVRAANASDRPDIVTGAGVVLQLGSRIEFWIPSVEFKEGRVSPFSFETAYRLVQPLTPGAERIHEFVFGIGGSF